MSKAILNKRKLLHIIDLFVGIFEEEDNDYPDYRIINNKERGIIKTLKSMNLDKDDDEYLYDFLDKNKFNYYANIFDKLRKEGYSIEWK